MRIRLLLLFLFFLFSNMPVSASVRSDIERGNKSFRKKKYDAAMEKYRKAADKNPDLSEAHFNMGDVYYVRRL